MLRTQKRFLAFITTLTYPFCPPLGLYRPFTWPFTEFHFLWPFWAGTKQSFFVGGLGAGRDVGEAADMLAANFEQACNRAAARGGWPAARPVWPLGGAY